MMTLVIILFFMIPLSVFSQCKKHFILDQSVTTGGIDGIDNYYLNLIIQDIALAGQQNFNEILLKFEYQIHYVTDRCAPGKVEISVLPLAVKCDPLFYHGYDISNAVKPEKADLVFNLLQDEGYISDSLIFYDISPEKDSNLYTTLATVRNDTSLSLSVSFSRAVFHFTQFSYNLFRDRILQIDQYYAASLVADSARVWADNGFLSETTGRPEMILRQAELGHIIKYIKPDQFPSAFLPGQYDLDGLNAKYHELIRKKKRFVAIISYDRFGSNVSDRMISVKEMIKNYLDRFDHYHNLAYHADFRFVNFIEGLARPDFNNAGLYSVYKALCRNQNVSRGALRCWCRLLVQGFIERGDSFDTTGNQLRALTYYNSAYDLARLMNLGEDQSKAIQLAGRMKSGISESYMEISRKSALTENPAMAAQYFREAMNLFTGKDEINPVPVWLHDYEIWLFENFESQAVKYIDLKNYDKALIYLNEIQFHCLSSASYSCPEKFHDWMGMVRKGVYLDLLDKAWNLSLKNESQAEEVYRQAVAMRSMAGYRIEKDVKEESLEVSFRQSKYDGLMQKGLGYYNAGEFVSALYFFNNALAIEKFVLPRPHPDLYDYRQYAARMVILQFLSDGRVKTWANDFEGAESVAKQVREMLTDYQFSENDSLTSQYFYLEENILQNKCEKIVEEFNDLMSKAESARVNNDLVLAGKMTEDAVNLSLTHLDCGIRDDDAWNQKVLLESPSDFRKMEKELDELVHKSSIEYLLAFQDLRNYYYNEKLLEQGVVFIPLFDRVIQQKDSAFLVGMLDHYIMLRDFDHAFRLLKRLSELGISSVNLGDQQKSVADLMARRDARDTTITKPWIRLESYVGHDKWFRSFRRSYESSWLKATGWKVKYWPFIWKK
jgi:hypothetical protein